MTPHKQLFLHDPDNGQYGDCFRTCVAMLLDVSPEEVPHEHRDCSGWEMEDLVNGYLEPMGLTVARVPTYYPHSPEEFLANYSTYFRNTAYMLSGKSPRGTQHVVVIDRDGRMHDPHPDDTGLTGHSDGWYFVILLARRL